MTFGSPRVGDAEFGEEYGLLKIPTTRYVYQLDPVSWVPGWLMGYRHVRPPTWFDGESWKAGLDWRGFLSVAWKMIFAREFLSNLWSNHAIENYVEALPASTFSPPVIA